jgi:uncharacterized membrane protein YfcA
MEHWELVIFFFGIALVYASVGFGGGSSYLAILALYNLDFLDVRATALLCNVAVVGGSILVYFQNRLIPWKDILPVVVFSVPCAFLGAMLKLEESVFFVLLASALAIAAGLMWFQPQIQKHETSRTYPLAVNGGLGGGIGFLSGMVGIGGGIFLSPLLHLMRWAQPKAIAASAAVFILVNSIAGLGGQFTQPGFNFKWELVLPLLIAVIAGGQIGSRVGISYFSQRSVKRATAILVMYVSVRIFIKYLF